MPVDKCKFGVFKGITVHMLYYYYDYYHHRRFLFGFLLKSHIWEREESRRSAERFCSQQHRRERDCSDELHQHRRHLTCCFFRAFPPRHHAFSSSLWTETPAAIVSSLQPDSFEKSMNFILQNTRASAPLQRQSGREFVLLCDLSILKD